jgi:CDP-glucose 4,6-dehydratase
VDQVVAGDVLSLFRRKRILLTGDTGFKGSWLGLWLSMLGADVVGYSLPPEIEKAHFVTSGIDGYIHHVDGDIRDLDALRQLFGEFQPEFLFHLAAQSLVGHSYRDPKLTFDTNIGGSVNILEMVRRTPSVRSAIYVTSDKCYQNKEWIWGYRENDELGGHDPYSASKAAAEVIFSSYYNSFLSGRQSLGIASVRSGNVIGGGDWSVDRIVPDAIKALLEGRPVVVRNPLSVRPWQHVLDPLFGYLFLSGRLYESPRRFSGSWNFGPEHRSIKTVLQLAEKIIFLWGHGELQVLEKKEGLHEATMLRLNVDKALSELQWVPLWDFDTAVGCTVEWYRCFRQSDATARISMEQIRKYMEDRNDRRC